MVFPVCERGWTPCPANVTRRLQEFNELRQPNTLENPNEHFKIIRNIFQKLFL